MPLVGGNVSVWKLSKLNVPLTPSIFDLWKRNRAYGSCVPRQKVGSSVIVEHELDTV